MRAFPGTGNGMAVRASGIQQLFSTPFQVRLLGVGKLRENGSGNRNERQVDGGTHASGSSLNEAPNRGGYSEKGFFCVLTPRSNIHFVMHPERSGCYRNSGLVGNVAPSVKIISTIRPTI
jgi:hypothetical protein